MFLTYFLYKGTVDKKFNHVTVRPLKMKCPGQIGEQRLKEHLSREEVHFWPLCVL